MSKRTQKESGEDRVTAKPKPMVNLVSRCSERTPGVLAFTASESPGNTRHESQLPLSSWSEQHPRTGKLVLAAYSSSCSEWNTDEKGLLKSGNLMKWWKNERGDVLMSNHPACSQSTQTDLSLMTMIWTLTPVTESDLSLNSQSFLNWVNDRVRKMLDHSSKDAMQDITLEASVFMGKNYSENLHSIKNTENDLSLKQMFDISEKLIVGTTDGIFGVSQINREDSPWRQLSFGQWWRSHQSLAREGLRILRFCVMPWKDESEPSITYGMGRQIDVVQKFTRIQSFGQNWWWADGIRVEHFPRFTTLQLVDKVQEFMSKMSDTEQFQGRIIFMSMFNDIIWWTKDHEKECIANSTFVSLFAKRLPAGHWSFFGPGSETKWYSTNNERPGGEGDKVAELMMIKFGESGHPVFRATSPLSRGTLKSKGGGKISIHFCADADTIETVFRTIISVSQLSIYGAVSDLCDEYIACQARTGKTRVGRTIWPIVRASKIIDDNTFTFDWSSCTRKFIAKVQGTSGKAPTTRSTGKSLCRCRIPENSWSRKILHDKNTDEFLQFAEPVTCRKYTPKGWIRGNTKIGPVLEVKTSYLQGKYGVEIRIDWICEQRPFSLVGQNFSWLEQIVHRLDRQEVPTTTSRKPPQRRRKYLRLQADTRLKHNREDFPLLAHLQRLYNIEPGAQFDQAYPVAKKTLGDWKMIFGIKFENSRYWSDDVWTSKMAGGTGNKKRFQFCADPSGEEILYLRALQFHSGRNPIDPSLQDNVLIPNDFFEYIFNTSDVQSVYTPSQIQD